MKIKGNKVTNPASRIGIEKQLEYELELEMDEMDDTSIFLYFEATDAQGVKFALDCKNCSNVRSVILRKIAKK